jgi:hypothetical protein
MTGGFLFYVQQSAARQGGLRSPTLRNRMPVAGLSGQPCIFFGLIPRWKLYHPAHLPESPRLQREHLFQALGGST